MDSSMTTSMVAFATSIDNIPLPDFVSLDMKYVCVYCHLVLNMPRQLPCGHRICKLCVNKLFESAVNQLTIRCPSGDVDCDSDIRTDQIYPDFSAQREMRQFHVYCMFKMYGCRQTMPWSQYKAHIEQCIYRLQRCKYCQDEIPFTNLQSHIDSECLSFPCPCPYKCLQMIPRSELAAHTTCCPCRPRPCPLHVAGCKFQGTESDVISHQNNEHWHHIQLLASQLHQLPMDTVDHSATAAATASHFEDLKLLKLQHSQYSQQLTDIETRLSATATLDELRRTVQEKDSLIAQLQQRIIELDLRCQFFETASHDGLLLWKVANVDQRISDAKERCVVSLYSPPFYAGRYGYKLCARVYFNGDGDGYGTHVSLFFVIMKGEYDDLLEWPFTGRVTLTLIDQSPARRHHSETFRPDPQSSSFHKPETPTNIASGSPRFISHKKLLEVGQDGQSFVKNETVYFRVVINMSDITEL